MSLEQQNITTAQSNVAPAPEDKSSVGATRQKSLMLIVGDPSADRHMESILKLVKQSAPDLNMWGVGGERMEEIGVELLADLKDFAVIGFFEIIEKVPRILKMGHTILMEIEKRKPDVIMMVDFGGFNLKIVPRIRKKFPNQKLLYFISPQIWASRPWRIKTIAANVSKMLVIFPFEEPLYASYGVPARFVGHPLTLHIPNEQELLDKETFTRTHELRADKPIIAVLPGSRKQEIKTLLPILLTAMEELLSERPDLQFVVSKANKTVSELVDKIYEKHKIKKRFSKNVIFLDGSENYNLFKNSDLVWAKSGTTTLEVAMFGKPMLIIYRGALLSYFLVVLVLTVKNVGLPNLLAGRTLVPELLQLDCRPQQLVRYTSDLLDVPGLRNEISDELLKLRDQLGQGNYVENCAQEILAALNINP